MVVTVFVLSVSLTTTPEYPVDDAYISFRYSKNWAQGYGPVFNPGARVEGYSSFLWIVFLSLLFRMGVTLPLAARLLSIIAMITIFWILLERGANRSKHFGCWLLMVGATLFIATSPSTLFNVLSGTESPMAALLVLLGVYLLQAPFHPLLSPLVLLLLSLTRPEGIFVSLAILAVEFVVQILVRADRRRIYKISLMWAVGLVIPYALYIGWRIWFYGYPLPNTIYAKSGLVLPTQVKTALIYVTNFAKFYWPIFIGSLGIVFLLNDRVIRGALTAVCAWGLIVMFSGGGDPYPHWRYLYPILPLIAMLAAEGLQAIYLRVAKSRSKVNEGQMAGFLLFLSRGFGLLIIALILITQTPVFINSIRKHGKILDHVQRGIDLLFTQDLKPHLEGADRSVLNLHYLAAWLMANTSPLDLLATSEVGIAPYYSDIRACPPSLF